MPMEPTGCSSAELAFHALPASGGPASQGPSSGPRPTDSSRDHDAAQPQLIDILERLGDGLIAFDWRSVCVNRQAARLSGRNPEKLFGRHIWTVFPESVGGPFQPPCQRERSFELFNLLVREERSSRGPPSSSSCPTVAHQAFTTTPRLAGTMAGEP